MPITCTVDRERDLLVIVATGRLSGAEILTHLEERERVEAPLSPLRGLVDATGANYGAMSQAEVLAIAERLKHLRKQHDLGATAIVVGNTASYGVLRMLGVLAEDVCRVRPFMDRQDAEEWLNSGAP